MLLNVMTYELLNPMFCVWLCLQLLMLHTNYVLKICWGLVPNRPTLLMSYELIVIDIAHVQSQYWFNIK